MSPAARRVAAALASVALCLPVGIAVASAPSYAGQARASASVTAAQRPLRVTFGGVSPALGVNRHLHLAGVLQSVGRSTWYSVQVYLLISYRPATTEVALPQLATTTDPSALGNVSYANGFSKQVGDVQPGQRASFHFKVPFDLLAIDKQAGVYRVGVKVVGTTAAGESFADAGAASTLLPLLPYRHSGLVPAQTLTLLPISAPVKRLSNGEFADDSLGTSLGHDGRLTNLMSWATAAPADTLQIVVDPALLTAIEDMSHGYRVASAHRVSPRALALGKAGAVTWMLNFDRLISTQRIMLLPWGVPAANSLISAGVPGPVVASLRASATYLTAHPYGTSVTGWLTDGKTGIRALRLMHAAGADLQIVAESSLPGLPDKETPPPVVDIRSGRRLVPALVTATNLAGLPITVKTTALQFRQELIADAAIRAISSDTASITVAALPFRWDPGPGLDQGLGGAFKLPILAAQSAIGTLDQPTAPRYSGLVRPGPGTPTLGPHMLDAIHALRRSAGALAAILRPAAPAQADYDRALAMAGSHLWHTYPRVGVALVLRRAAAARAQLTKVTLTGPPFVAMSSTSGRFPLTITNGLSQRINVRLDVIPADPAVRVNRPGPIRLSPGQRSDITVVTTARGSGLTSVRAQLATPRNERFGKPWRFDIRATQIGLVIWIVMGVGGTILFGVAGYRIVNRIRGIEPTRRRAAS